MCVCACLCVCACVCVSPCPSTFQTDCSQLTRPPPPPPPRPQRYRYQIIKFDRPNYVELKGQSDTVTVIDMISLSKNGDKTHVDYKVDLTLKGWRRPFIAFLGGALNTLGKDAMDGMRNTLTRERVAELEKEMSASSAAASE